MSFGRSFFSLPEIPAEQVKTPLGEALFISAVEKSSSTPNRVQAMLPALSLVETSSEMKDEPQVSRNFETTISKTEGNNESSRDGLAMSPEEFTKTLMKGVSSSVSPKDVPKVARLLIAMLLDREQKWLEKPEPRQAELMNGLLIGDRAQRFSQRILECRLDEPTAKRVEEIVSELNVVIKQTLDSMIEQTDGALLNEFEDSVEEKADSPRLNELYRKTDELTRELKELTEPQRMAMEKVINDFAAEMGLPKAELQIMNDMSSKDAHGYYRSGTGIIGVHEVLFFDPRKFVDTVGILFHEFSHLEQDSLIIRRLADKLGVAETATEHQMDMLKRQYESDLQVSKRPEWDEFIKRVLECRKGERLTVNKSLRADILIESRRVVKAQHEEQTALRSKQLSLADLRATIESGGPFSNNENAGFAERATFAVGYTPLQFSKESLERLTQLDQATKNEAPEDREVALRLQLLKELG
ncbi:MAG: hypothetical protein K2Z81_11735, partial [Cyanobacteria bacterium]|nr:hypothetical protein [Cyanobacteriota bacterium]